MKLIDGKSILVNMYQAISLANIDSDLYRNMVSLGANPLTRLSLVPDICVRELG